MGGYKVRLIVFCLIVGLYLSLSHPFYPALALQEGDSLDGSFNGDKGSDGGANSDSENTADITIETEIGPEFKETDSEEIEACSLNVFANKFPLDFVQAPVLGGKRTCPELTMFGMTHEACFIVDVFEKIEPGILAGMFIEQGTGKSFSAMKTVLPFANLAEYDLCFNYEINLRALYDYCIVQGYNWLACRILHNKVRVKDSEDLEEFMDLPKTIYILDEAGVYLNSRAFQSVPKTFLAQLAQVRHDQKILVWCAQYADMVDRILRELTAMYCQCLSVSKFSKELCNYEMYWQKIYIYNARKYKIYLSKIDQKLSGIKFWINSRKLADWHYEGLLSEEDRMIFDIYNSFGSHIGYGEDSDAHNYFDLELFSSVKSSRWVDSPLSSEEIEEIKSRLNLIISHQEVS